jgi:hypothetical protein
MPSPIDCVAQQIQRLSYLNFQPKKFQFFSLSSQSSFQLSLTLLVFYRSSTLYLELDEIYHLFWTLISKNSTLKFSSCLRQLHRCGLQCYEIVTLYHVVFQQKLDKPIRSYWNPGLNLLNYNSKEIYCRHRTSAVSLSKFRFQICSFIISFAITIIIIVIFFSLA